MRLMLSLAAALNLPPLQPLTGIAPLTGFAPSRCAPPQAGVRGPPPIPSRQFEALSSPDNFGDTIQKARRNQITVVKFQAPWCRTCRAMAPSSTRLPWGILRRLLFNQSIRNGRLLASACTNFHVSQRGARRIRASPSCKRVSCAHAGCFRSTRLLHRSVSWARACGSSYCPPSNLEILSQALGQALELVEREARVGVASSRSCSSRRSKENAQVQQLQHQSVRVVAAARRLRTAGSSRCHASHGEAPGEHDRRKRKRGWSRMARERGETERACQASINWGVDECSWNETLLDVGFFGEWHGDKTHCTFSSVVSSRTSTRSSEFHHMTERIYPGRPDAECAAPRQHHRAGIIG